MSMDKLIAKKKWPPRRIIAYTLIGLFVLLVGYLLVFQSNRSTLNVEKEKLTISTVQRGPFQEFIPVNGRGAAHADDLPGCGGGRPGGNDLHRGRFGVKKGDKILKLSNTSLLMDIMYREAEAFPADQQPAQHAPAV